MLLQAENARLAAELDRVAATSAEEKTALEEHCELLNEELHTQAEEVASSHPSQSSWRPVEMLYHETDSPDTASSTICVPEKLPVCLPLVLLPVLPFLLPLVGELSGGGLRGSGHGDVPGASHPHAAARGGST